MTEFTGKVGTQGEIYFPKKFHEKLGLKANSQIQIKILENGHMLITPIQSLSELLKSSRPRRKIDPNEVERYSEELQEKMISEEN